jgi:hypothetical protein
VKVGFGASVSEFARAPVAARARTESATLRICGTKDRENGKEGEYGRNWINFVIEYASIYYHPRLTAYVASFCLPHITWTRYIYGFIITTKLYPTLIQVDLHAQTQTALAIRPS